MKARFHGMAHNTRRAAVDAAILIIFFSIDLHKNLSGLYSIQMKMNVIKRRSQPLSNNAEWPLWTFTIFNEESTPSNANARVVGNARSSADSVLPSNRDSKSRLRQR